MDVTLAGMAGTRSGGQPPGVLALAATGIGGYIEEVVAAAMSTAFLVIAALLFPDLAGSPTLKLRLSAFVELFEESARQTGNDSTPEISMVGATEEKS